jgi:response regulator RpfG family c-di-GMP phosphodiesterase
MSQKTVLSVGQCGPDHASISNFLNRHFDVRILTADLPEDTLQTLRAKPVDLVLINRKLDTDYSEGMDILRALKSDPDLSSIPAMIVSNFEESQQAAVAAGAQYGIGKSELSTEAAREKVAVFLG